MLRPLNKPVSTSAATAHNMTVWMQGCVEKLTSISVFIVNSQRKFLGALIKGFQIIFGLGSKFNACDNIHGYP